MISTEIPGLSKYVLVDILEYLSVIMIFCSIIYTKLNQKFSGIVSSLQVISMVDRRKVIVMTTNTDVKC